MPKDFTFWSKSTDPFQISNVSQGLYSGSPPFVSSWFVLSIFSLWVVIDFVFDCVIDLGWLVFLNVDWWNAWWFYGFDVIEEVSLSGFMFFLWDFVLLLCNHYFVYEYGFALWIELFRYELMHAEIYMSVWLKFDSYAFANWLIWFWFPARFIYLQVDVVTKSPVYCLPE